MYTPPHFREDRHDILMGIIVNARLATLVTLDDLGGFEANHFPILLDRASGSNGTIIGHCAKGNPLATHSGRNAIAIFAGPEAYVSPSWYPTKAETGKVVPTWNYVAVHVHGILEIFEDSQRLVPLLDQLTDRHESKRQAPWSMSDAPDDFIQAQLKRIVGFSLTIDRIEGKSKISQNRTASEQAGVIDGLHQDGEEHEHDLADFMAQSGQLSIPTINWTEIACLGCFYQP